MASNFIQPGHVMDWTNSTDADVKSGDVVVLGERIGIAAVDIAVGDQGAVKVTGVWVLPKSNAAYTQGQEPFWNPATGKVVAATAEGAVSAGYVWDNAEAGDTVVHIKIG